MKSENYSRPLKNFRVSPGDEKYQYMCKTFYKQIHQLHFCLFREDFLLWKLIGPAEEEYYNNMLMYYNNFWTFTFFSFDKQFG